MFEMGAVEAVDYHTAGEPFRIVTGGVPPLAGATVLERRRHAATHLDHVRRFLVHEPRGHADMYGGYPVPPDDGGADLGVVFFHNEGYSTACGHGTIAMVTWALDSGLVAKHDGECPVVLDVPSGRLACVATVQSGIVRSVRFRNVASFVVARDVDVGGGRRVDISFGGAFYAVLQERVEVAELSRLVGLAGSIKAALRERTDVVHPLEAELHGIYGVIFWQEEPDGPYVQRNLTVFADAEVDRSPCGSCTSARLALLDADGALPLGQVLVNRSVIGTEFRAVVVGRTTVAGRAAVLTEVEGRAHRTGVHTFTLDPEDPLGLGFLVR